MLDVIVTDLNRCIPAFSNLTVRPKAARPDDAEDIVDMGDVKYLAVGILVVNRESL